MANIQKENMRPVYYTTDIDDRDYIQEHLFNDLGIKNDWGSYCGRYVISVPESAYRYALSARPYLLTSTDAQYINNDDILKDLVFTQIGCGILPDGYKDTKGNDASRMLLDPYYQPKELRQYLREMKDYIKVALQVEYRMAKNGLDIDMMGFDDITAGQRFQEFVFEHGYGPFIKMYQVDVTGKCYLDDKGEPRLLRTWKDKK